jgi:predicted amidohydrolase YtcJ
MPKRSQWLQENLSRLDRLARSANWPVRIRRFSGSELAVGVDLSEIEDKDEWLRIVRDKAQSLSDGEWILGGAWDHNLSDGILPERGMLDAVAPENPVLLRDIDGHTSWANSLAIELAGLTADSPVPPGGEIMVDPASGEAGIKAAVKLANSLGITAVHDMSANFDEFLSVLDDGELTLRVWQGARPERGSDTDPAEIFADMARERDRVRQHVAAHEQTESMGTLFDIGYTKLIIDGVLSTHTALHNLFWHAQPLLALRPAREMQVPYVPGQMELFQAHNHQTYVADPGVHGSSMLNEARVGESTQTTWAVVLHFLEANLLSSE